MMLDTARQFERKRFKKADERAANAKVALA
jgi:hypothetical protein